MAHISLTGKPTTKAEEAPSIKVIDLGGRTEHVVQLSTYRGVRRLGIFETYETRRAEGKDWEPHPVPDHEELSYGRGGITIDTQYLGELLNNLVELFNEANGTNLVLADSDDIDEAAL